MGGAVLPGRFSFMIFLTAGGSLVTALTSATLEVKVWTAGDGSRCTFFSGGAPGESKETASLFLMVYNIYI